MPRLSFSIHVIGVCFTVAFTKVPSAVAFGLLLMTAAVCADYEDMCVYGCVCMEDGCLCRCGVCVDGLSMLVVCLSEWCVCVDSLCVSVCVCMDGVFV